MLVNKQDRAEYYKAYNEANREKKLEYHRWYEKEKRPRVNGKVTPMADNDDAILARRLYGIMDKFK